MVSRINNPKVTDLNNFAESNLDIIEGLERSSAAMSAMGQSFEDTAALFTGGMEITQNAEKMGTALRSMSMRIRGYSEDSEDGLETIDESLSNITGDLINLTKTAENPNGISIYTDDTKNLDEANKKYKSLVEYLGQISDAWDTFSETQRTNLLQTMFGKNRAQEGAAIITNFDQVRASIEAMENSAGSADREMETIRQSLTYKINNLKETWVGTAQEMLKRGSLGGLIDGLTSFSSVIGTVISKIGLLGTVGATTGLFMGAKNKGVFRTIDTTSDKLSDNVGIFGKSITDIKRDKANGYNIGTSIFSGKNVTKNDVSAVKQLNKALGEGSTRGQAWNATMKNCTSEAKRQASAIIMSARSTEEARDGLANLSNSMQAVSLKTKVATTAFKALSVVGNTLMFMGVSMAISAIISGISKLANAEKEAKENSESFLNSYKSLNDETNKNKKEISDLETRYKELSKGVSSLGENVSLTNEEYSEYKDIISSISEIMPELAVRYNEQGEKIGFIKGNLKDLNAEYEKYQQNQAKKILSEGFEDGSTVKDVFKNFNNKENKVFGMNPATEEKVSRLKYEIKNGTSWEDIDIKNKHRFSNEEIEKKKAELEKLQGELDTAAQSVDAALVKIAQSKNEFYKLSEEQKTNLQNFLGNISYDTLKSLNINDEESARAFVNKTISSLTSNKNKDAFRDAFNELYQINIDDENLSAEEIQKKVNKVIAKIAKALGINTKDGKKQLKIDLGFEVVDDNAQEYEHLKNKFLRNTPKKDKKGNKTNKYGYQLDKKHDTDVNKWIDNNNVTTKELESINKAGLDASDSVENLNNKLKELRDTQSNTSQKSFGKLFKETWKSLDNTDDEDLKNTKNDLLELASAGELTAKTFKNVSGSDKFLEKLGLSSKDTSGIDITIDKINKLVSSADQLSSLESGISSIQEAFKEFQENGSASAKTLASFPEELKNLKEFESFSKVLGDSSSTTNQCREAMNKLATEFVNSNNFLSQLNGTNEDYYISMLSNLGIENAEEVVVSSLKNKTAELNAEKLFLAETGKSVSSATYNEISNFLQHSQYAEEDRQAIARLALEKITANSTLLNFEGDINNLISYVNALNGATTALQEFQAWKNSGQQGPVNPKTFFAAQDEIEAAKNSQTTKVDTEPVKVSLPKDTSSKSNSNSGNNTKQKAEVTEQILDGIEIKLKKVSDAASKAKDKIDKMLSFGSKRKQTLKAINETTTAIKANLKAAQSYEAYANKAATTASKKVTNTLTTTSNDLVEEAKKYVGVLSYVYGGTSLTNGADCSGFVQQIYKEYGINLPRTSQAQWSSGGGTKVSNKKDLQPGDLVFFKGSNGSMSSPGHVAIYAGNGQIVEEYKTGTKARMTSLDSKSGYVGAKRYSSVSNMSTSDDSSSTSTKSKKVSSKTLTSYKKFIREGGLNETDILSITNENLKNAVSAYQTYHDKATSAKDSVSSLIDTLKDLYETLANNPIEKAAEKVEKLGTKLDILNAKSENFTVNFNGNSLDKTNYKNNMDSVISNYQQQTQAYLEAKNAADKNLTESNKTITKTSKSLNKTSLKKSGLSSKDQKKLKSYIKSKKFIPESLLAKIKNQKLLDKVLDYNEAIIGNEYFKEAVETANNNYEKAQAENETNQRQKRKDYFDQIAEAYENQISLIEGQAQKLSNEIDLVEAKGATISANFYKGQIDIENRKKAIYESEISDLEQQASTIQVGSDEWYECQQKIIDVKGEIQDSTKSIVEMNNQVIELANTFRTKLKDAIGTVSDEYDFMVGLMGNKDMFNEKTGLITNEGLATLSSYLTGIEVNKKKAEIDKQNVENLKKAMQTGSLSVEGYDTPFNSLEQLEEAYGNAFKDYRDEITKTYEYESKVIDMMRDKYESELDALQELIDKKKESLQAEKDLYDYQKQLKDSTKNIDTIQKQIISIQGDTSEEGMSRIQKLQKDLEDAQEDLIDTEREKALSDQEEMLDKLYDEYEETLKTEMQDQDALIRKGQMLVENNLTSIQNILNSYKDKYGYDYETLDSVLNNNNSLVGGINTTCNAIQTHLQSIKDNADKKSSEVVNEIVTALNGLSGNNNSTSNTSNTSTLTDLNGNPLPEQHLFTPDPQQTAQDEYKRQQHNLELLDKAIYFIQKHAKTYKHKPKSDVNKKIKANIGGGKWLSTANLQKLAAIVEVTYNGADKNENLYKKLKSLGLQGFAKGGIVSKLNKIALDNGDDAFATVKQGEAIFTPEQSKVFVKDFVPNMESMIDASKYLTDIIPKITPNQSIGGNNIEAYYNFNLENCTNANDIIRQIRDNKNVQNALMDVTINKSLGKGNLQINKYR